MNKPVKNKPHSVAARLSRIATESGITCKARKYELSEDVPVALARKFFEDPAKSDLWKAFSKRAGLTVAVGNLEDVVEELRKHLLPVLEKIHRKQP
jgi:hypothetical protein